MSISIEAYVADVRAALVLGDLAHGLVKSAIFAVLIAVVSSVNGASAEGGAEGVGRMTTRAVVQSIAAIVIADMIFVYIATR